MGPFEHGFKVEKKIELHIGKGKSEYINLYAHGLDIGLGLYLFTNVYIYSSLFIKITLGIGFRREGSWLVDLKG